MRVVREYFGIDRTTVTYEHEITGVGGDAGEFFVLCESGRQNDKPAVRMSVHFTHEEMAQLLADYRQHYPLDGEVRPFRLFGPRTSWRQRVTRWVNCLLQH